MTYKTNQELYDTAKARIAQFGRCGSEPGKAASCRYRDGKGGACAVGANITDEAYGDGLMEGVSINHLHGNGDYWLEDYGGYVPAERYLAIALNKSGVSFKSRDLLACLQSVHDTADSGDRALEAMRNVALTYDLIP
jgi:hypothetical protein